MELMVCGKCRRQLRIKKNGVPAVQLAEFGPYKLFEADVWECPRCHTEVLAGFSEGWVEHYEPRFPAELNRAQARPGYTEFADQDMPALVTKLANDWLDRFLAETP